MRMLIIDELGFSSFSGSPFLVNIGGEPSGRVTERIVRQKEAADITNVGSECELSLKIPGVDCNGRSNCLLILLVNNSQKCLCC